MSLGIGSEGSASADRAGDERLVDLRRGKESSVCLGCTIRNSRSIQRNPRWHYMQRWPSPKATKKLRDRVRGLTTNRHSGHNAKHTIAELTPVLRGWGNHFRTKMPTGSLTRWTPSWSRAYAAGSTGEPGNGPRSGIPFTGDHLYGMGLPKLMGSVKYPAQAHT